MELFRCDARIRFSPDIVVATSGRLKGRAPGGVADTLRLRCAEPEAPCDEALEPLGIAIDRATWRSRVRRLHREGRLARNLEWADDLGISASDARRIAHYAHFGAAWSAIEAASPLLARRSLTPSELPDQIASAERALRLLRKEALSTPQDVEPEVGISIAADNARGAAHRSDEEFGGLVAT